MIIKFPMSKLSLLLLTAVALAFTSCDDDDDPILGGQYDDDGTVFLSSNTSGMVGILDTKDTPLEIETFMARGTDADGIYYDDDQGNIFQINRSSSTIVEYNDVIDDLDDPNGVDIESESSMDFDNGRGLAYRNDMLVVANDNDSDSTMNAFYRYEITGDEEISYVGMHPTNINLWGIQFFGTSLYAVVDNSDSIAIFDNFLDNAAGDTVTPTRYIQVEGITRTHGLEYNNEDDVMVLTDIGDAGSDSDGALIIIEDFATLSGNVITEADYTRIAGASTMLGNPVDVDYDAEDDRIYVAEKANGGGQLLIFDMDMSGDVAPAEMLPFPGISSLFFYRD
ncbi:hypothetical protein [Lewinella sp. IMCC34191]|uniref:hypothetical protein n=1 Tax=Lewinella sp. IMCC34191 TaxID=2259172 RepID=UPI0013007822|nr:hypothetical protein [Lewinella sp. IMCC34191]